METTLLHVQRGSSEGSAAVPWAITSRGGALASGGEGREEGDGQEGGCEGHGATEGRHTRAGVEAE